MTKAKKKKTDSTVKSGKDLIKKEYTEEEEARIANYAERSKREPARFVSVENGSGAPMIMS